MSGYSGVKVKNSTMKGKDKDGNELDMKLSAEGHTIVNIDKIERVSDTNGANTDNSAESIRMAGITFSGSHKTLQCSGGGILKVHKDTIRQSHEETISIPANAIGYSSVIQMAENEFLACYGKLTRADNSNIPAENKIFLEYSNNGTDWYRGAEDASKIILVSANDENNGEYYENHRIITPYVRLSRKNDSNIAESWMLIKTKA